MTTIRVAKRDRFTTVARTTVNDTRLSFRSLGLLIWLLDKPDDWRVAADAIADNRKEGRDAVRTALRELEDCGYVERLKERDETGRWSTTTIIHETPAHSADNCIVPAQTSDWKSGVGEPALVSRPSETQGLIQKTVTEDCRRDTRADEFDQFWTAYPRKIGKPAARKAFDAALKHTDAETVMTGLAHWRAYWTAEGTASSYMPHPTTWLRQQRFDDRPDVVEAPPSGWGLLSSMLPWLHRRWVPDAADLEAIENAISVLRKWGYADGEIAVRLAAISRFDRSGMSQPRLVANLARFTRFSGMPDDFDAALERAYQNQRWSA